MPTINTSLPVNTDFHFNKKYVLRDVFPDPNIYIQAGVTNHIGPIPFHPKRATRSDPPYHITASCLTCVPEMVDPARYMSPHHIHRVSGKRKCTDRDYCMYTVFGVGENTAEL